MTFYDFAIKQVKQYMENEPIRNFEQQKSADIFQISEVLQIIFEKPKEVIVKDIVSKG